MALRMNARLIGFVALGVCFLTLVVGGFAYLKYSNDPDRNIRRAEAFLDEGDLESAYNEMGRAVRKVPGNRAFLEQLRDILVQMEPRTSDLASERYGEYRQILAQFTQYFREDPQVHIDYLRELVRWAETTRSGWPTIEQAANHMLDSLPETEPQRSHGRFYRGVAIMRQWDNASEEERAEAYADLAAFLEEAPEDEILQRDQAWAEQIAAKLREVESLRFDGLATRAESVLEEARSMLAEARRAVPRRPYIEVTDPMLRHVEAPHRGIDATTADELGLAIVEQLRPSDPTWLMTRALGNVRQLGSEFGLERGREIMIDALAQRPDDLFLKSTLVAVHRSLDDFDRAKELAAEIIAIDTLPVGLDSAIRQDIRKSVAADVAQMTFVEWDKANSRNLGEDVIEARRAAFEEARQTLIELVGSETGDDGVILANAHQAFIDERYYEAVEPLEELIRGPFADNVYTVLLAARCQIAIGNKGRALEHITTALESAPSNPDLLAGRVDYLIQTGQPDEARTTLQQFASLHPNDRRLGDLALRLGEGADDEERSQDQVLVDEAMRLAQDDRFDDARSRLFEALDEDPDNVVIVWGMARLAYLEDDLEKTVEWVDRGLELAPDSVSFKRLRVAATEPDEVQRRLTYVDSLDLDEAEAVLRKLSLLTGFASSQEREAAAAEQAGRTADAEVHRDHVARSEAIIEELLAEAADRFPEHPELVQFRFATALAAEDWQAAEELADLAREKGLDKAGGLLFSGQLARLQGDLSEARSLLLQAVDVNPNAVDVLAELARTHVRLGEFDQGALRYQQAFSLDPSEPLVATEYITLLRRMGDDTRALQIARQASEVSRDNARIRSMRLQLEFEVGDPAFALESRRKRLRERPEDRIARIYGLEEPSRRTMLDTSGEPRFPEGRWSRMSVPERSQRIDEEKQRWRREALSILDQIEERDDQRRLDTVALRAEIERRRGSSDAGLEILTSYIESIDDDQLSYEPFRELGLYHRRAGNERLAEQTFLEGRNQQVGSEREMDELLAALYLGRREWQKALDHLEAVAKAGERPDVEQDIVRCLASMGEFSRAEERLRSLADEYGMNHERWLTVAEVAQMQGLRAFDEGREAQANIQFAKFDDAIEKAETLEPTAVAPKLRAASQYMAMFRRTNDPALLERASRKVSEAEQLLPNSPEVMLTRLGVLQLQNDEQGMIGQMNRYLEVVPDDIVRRARLIDLEMARGNFRTAERLVKEAIDRQPNMVAWHFQLGDLLARDPDRRQEAIASYQQAMTIDSTVKGDASGKIAQVLLDVGEPRADRQALQVLNAASEAIGTNPDLRVVYVSALARNGDLNEARAQLRQAWIDYDEEQGGFGSQENHIRWFIAARDAYAQQCDEVDPLVRELSNGDPSVGTLRLLARHWATCGSSGIQQSVQVQEQAIARAALESDDVRAQLYYTLGEYQNALRDLHAAAAAFKSAADLAPSAAAPANNYAYLAADTLGKPSEAIPYAERAVEIAPDVATYRDTLGWVYHLAGQDDRAAEELRRSLDLQSVPDVRYRLARVLADLGEIAEAQAELRRAAEQNPSPAMLEQINALADELRRSSSSSLP